MNFIVVGKFSSRDQESIKKDITTKHNYYYAKYPEQKETNSDISYLKTPIGFDEH